jgi:hypothetical protein
VLSLTDAMGRCTVVKSATIVKRSWNQEKCTLPWPCLAQDLTLTSRKLLTTRKLNLSRWIVTEENHNSFF